MRKESIIPNHIYHIYNRGINRQPIFFLPKNWDYFMVKLRQYFSLKNTEIIAYCLMPNHFHLMVSVLCEYFGNEIMMPFQTSYTKAINIQENRCGPLFQGRYQAKLIETDEAVLQLSRYIHLNPVTAGLTMSPQGWKYSSYLDYIGMRDDAFVHKNKVLEYFPNQQNYQFFVEESLNP